MGFVRISFFTTSVISSLANHKAGGSPLYRPSEISYLTYSQLLSISEAVSSIRNLRTRHRDDVATGSHITRFLTVRGEQRLRAFENKVLRKIFDAKTDEITG